MTCLHDVKLGPSADDEKRWAAHSQAATAKMFEEAFAKPRAKFSHIGAPACFALEEECKKLNRAFGGHCYQVGSSLERPDWRDVDIRMILADADFATLFPNAGDHWEHDPRWTFMVIAISERLSKITGLPIDFQFQPQTHANARHPGKRNAKGMSFA